MPDITIRCSRIYTIPEDVIKEYKEEHNDMDFESDEEIAEIIARDWFVDEATEFLDNPEDFVSCRAIASDIHNSQIDSCT